MNAPMTKCLHSIQTLTPRPMQTHLKLFLPSTRNAHLQTRSKLMHELKQEQQQLLQL
jgi:hypothetical protein